ncbi:MAG TPA: germination protein YpeB [Eubacteriales bacterium]|nr:germination protein YpeB [Clostridia bacterium]HRR89910.1 germination protein YpeB [Eubacteriales bacterium]HRU83766.1 germination protein YpeB [Eubacteriales bacterium]
MEKQTEKKRAVMITTIVILALAVAGLSIALSMSMPRTEAEAYKNMLEASYQKSYYDLVAATNEIEVKLKKLDVANTSEMQESILYEIWKSAEVAEMSIANLSSLTETAADTAKFINQTGDYAYFLSLQIGEGEMLNETQKNTLKKMSEMFSKLRTELAKIQVSLSEGSLFLNEDKIDIAGDVFKGLSSESVEYPQMIYDGPFSDAMQNKEPKGLSGEEITMEQGRDKLAELFDGREVSDVVFAGEWSGKLVTLNYNLKVDGANATAQLAKKGGMPILLTVFKDNGDRALSDEDCIDRALDYAQANGFENLEAVWISDYSGLVFVNLAPKEDGVILYPDLIKVKISGDTGEVLGFDAKSYAFNHTEREIGLPLLSEAQAKANISSVLTAGDGRLAVIPLDNGSERLTYEFSASYEGSYLVYIDANTGKEVNILFVIDSDEGKLLL